MKIKNKIVASNNATSYEKATYASFFVGQNIIYQLVTLGLTFYWTAVLGIGAALAGVIMMIAKFWDAINDPILAGVINKTGKTRFGHYRPWLFVSAFLLPIFLVVIFSAPFNNNTGKIVWAVVSYMIFWMVYTITDVPIFALSVVMEPNLRKRTKILLIGRIASALAGIIVGSLYNYIVVGNPTVSMFLYVAISLGILSFILMIPVIIVRERNEIKDPPPVTIKSMIMIVFKNKHLLKLTLIMLIQRLFFGALVINSYLITKQVFINISPELAIVTSIVSGILQFFLTIFLAKMLMSLGARKSIIILEFFGLILLISTGILTFYTRNAWSWFVMSFGMTLILLVPTVVNKGKLTVECIEYGHYKTGRRDEAIGFAVQTLVGKFVAGISALLIGVVVEGIGYKSGNAIQASGVLEGLFWFLFGGIAFTCLFNIFAYAFFYNLRTKDVQIMSLANRGKITKEQAHAELAKPYKERSVDNFTIDKN